MKKVVDALVIGMDEIYKGLQKRMETNEKEMRQLDQKWSEYRDDIKKKHEYMTVQEEFLEKAEAMTRRTMGRWIAETTKDMDSDIWKMRCGEFKLVDISKELERLDNLLRSQTNRLEVREATTTIEKAREEMKKRNTTGGIFDREFEELAGQSTRK